MRYMLLLYQDEKQIDMSPEEMAKWEAFTKEVTDAGARGRPCAPARPHRDDGSCARW